MSDKRVWETKLTAVNHHTGSLQQYIAPQYFAGVNYQEAAEQLSKSGFTYLQLTGESFLSIEEASNLRKIYDDITEPYNLVSDMTTDEFLDWIALADDINTLQDALEAFRNDGRVGEHVKMIEGYIKFKYGSKTSEEEGEKDS